MDINFSAPKGLFENESLGNLRSFYKGIRTFLLQQCDKPEEKRNSRVLYSCGYS